jgi:ssDNA-binding replication factor A large subunit
MEEKTRKRSETLKVAGKRDNARSDKPQLNNKKEEKPVIDQDEVDMNMYLGVAIPKENLGTAN